VYDAVPVGHELFVDVILIEQWRALETSEQVVTDPATQLLRKRVLVEPLQDRPVVGEPLVNLAADCRGENLKLTGVENRLLNVTDVDGKVAVAGTVRFEQSGTQARKRVPVGTEGVEVAFRDSAVQVSAKVLEVFELRRVDVARDIERL
jgi:hypothetical protein